MPVPVHGRIRISGLLYGSALWSIGLNVAVNDGGDPFGEGNPTPQPQLEEWADNVRALNSNSIFPETWLGLLSNSGTITAIRTARIGTDGKETAVAMIQGAPDLAVGASTHNMPVQTAIAVSLLSGRPGPSYRGRLYLPCISASTSPTGRLSVPATGTVASEGATFIRAVAQALPLGVGQAGTHVPAVVSGVKNVATPVTSVRVGDRFDSQRRRAESQDEAYASSAVAQ